MINTWPGWENVGLLGEGSFGKVYKIRREEYGQVYEAALKVITIPASQSDVKAAYEEGMDEESVTKYFHSFVEDIVAEFALMSQLKGNSHIVSYEDHMVVQHEEGVGWDILIRMELLTTLPDYGKKHPLTENDVIQLGIHMCHALELCRKRGILHRDIKPENIFVSRDGDFKLGDFGVARVAEKTITVMSRKGTYNYMAPEVFKSEKYGYAADICSLGLVLYRYLNDNRTPFLPAYPQPLTYSDREKALEMRMSGETMPAPTHGSEGLQTIVLKACAYRPEDRYGSPEEMRHALEGLLLGVGPVTEPKEEEPVQEGPVKEGPVKGEISTKEEAPKITEEKPVKNKAPKAVKEKKPSNWSVKPMIGVAAFAGVLVLTTLLFHWDVFFDLSNYLRVFMDPGYETFRFVMMMVVWLIVPMTMMGCWWPKLRKTEDGKRGKSMAVVVVLLLMAGIYGSTGLMEGEVEALGALIQYPMWGILGIAFPAGLWTSWYLLRKRQLLDRRWAGVLINTAILVVLAIMMTEALSFDKYSAQAEMSLTWVYAQVPSDYDTPSVLMGTAFRTVMVGLMVKLVGYLWTAEKKWGKWAYAGVLIAEAVLLFLPVEWVLNLCMDLYGLPVITVIGFVLGAGILVAVQKLPGLLKKRPDTKKSPKDRKGKAKKKTSDEVPSEDKVE
ncbi:MAG: protein kinase [Lachnospiraceae bacterium]|nr:protein kinase [Lachnospiraceae bacterium]